LVSVDPWGSPEGWQVVATSQNETAVAVILGNPAMIDAYRTGIPDNGEPFPDGAKMAKVHRKKSEFLLREALIRIPSQLLL
jgi:hypothetical protein